MGFYGNIANTSRTTFSFDKVYSNRVLMDNNAESDEVFLGRYVLVEYDNPPINGYYNNTDKWFYNTENFTAVSKMTTPKTGQVYRNLFVDVMDISSNRYPFYYYNGSEFIAYTSGTSQSNYGVNYIIDVNNYGRGYDSTAWIKQFDIENNVYRYVLIAELNTIVPKFHMLADAPTPIPITPFFDEDSTNVDYYLHTNSPYGIRLAKWTAGNTNCASVSDAMIKYNSVTQSIDANKQVIENQTETDTSGDIYFNKTGFSKETRSIIDESIINNIFVTNGQTGKKYILKDNQFQNESIVADDVHDLHIHLPAIGNAICEVYDRMYGYNGTSRYYLQQTTTQLNALVQSYKDNGDGTFIDSSGVNTTTIAAIPKTLYYNTDTDIYYGYIYNPVYIADENGIYYLNENIYKVANKNILAADTQYYSKVDAWSLSSLTNSDADTFRGLLFNVSNLLGLGDVNDRNIVTANGCINYLKDIINNISTQLDENKLVLTDDNGTITTSNTQFPSAADDENRVLTGKGNWENRYKTINTSNNTAIIDSGINTANLTAVNSAGTLDSLSIISGNKWVRLFGESGDTTKAPKLTIGHIVQSIPLTTPTIDLNDISNQDKFNIIEHTYDEAGHIRSQSTTTYTLPYNYKTINVKNSGTSIANTSIKDDGCIAKNSLDQLEIDVGNKWIVLNADNTTDSIVVSHYIKSFIPTTSVKDLNSFGTFDIVEHTYDEAGHIVSKDTKTYTLPYNYKTITVGSASTSVMSIASAPGSCSAKNQVDTLTVNSGNKWIVLGNAISSNIITASHYVHTIPVTTAAIDFNNANTETFSVIEHTYDEAGHIITKNTTTYTMPYNYKIITVGAENTGVTALAANTEAISCIAEDRIDELTINSGNKWIVLNSNNTSKTITAAHKLSVLAAGEYGNSIQTPAFGDTFTVPHFTTDEAGHIIATSTHTITVPRPSLTDGTGDVMTSLSMVQSTGALTVTKTNADKLLLTDYTAATESASDVQNTDTIHSAISKLQKQIKDNSASSNVALGNEITNRENADNSLDGRLDIIEGSDEGSITKAVNDLKGTPVTYDTLAKLETALSNEITNRETADTNVVSIIQALDVADTSVANQYVSQVSQADGKIYVGRMNLPDYSDTYEQKGAAADVQTTLETSINNKVDKVENSTLLSSDQASQLLQLYDWFSNFNVTMILTAPTIASFSLNSENNELTVTLSNIVEGDTYTYTWYKKLTGETDFTVIEAVTNNTYTATETGLYKCLIVRTHTSANNIEYTSQVETSEQSVTINP